MSADRTFVRTLPDTYLACRTMRHAWNPQSMRLPDLDDARVPALYERGFRQIIVRVSQCLRCETTRIDYYGRYDKRKLRFERIDSTYWYPTDYQFHGDKDNRPDLGDYTFEQWDRIGLAIPMGEEFIDA